MTTEQRWKQNQENAQNSTGPKTEEGKRRASINGVRHNLTGQAVLLPDDDFKKYMEFGRKAMAHHKPVGWDEEQQVITIYETEWRLRRVRALEHNLIALRFLENFDKVPYNEVEPGYVLLVQARNSELITKELALYSLYECRLNRTLIRSHKRLEELQTKRKAEQHQQFEEATLLCRAAKVHSEPWLPADDGFGFSLSEIESAIRRTDRLIRARQSALGVQANG